MSQYPYQPPDPNVMAYMYAWEEHREMLAPAKRAGVMMLVLGILGLTCSLCLGTLSVAMPWDRLPPEMEDVMSRFEAETQMPMRTAFIMVAAMSAIPAVLMIILSFFVRRGGGGAVWTSIVLVSLLLLGMLANMVFSLQGAARARNPGSICAMTVPIVLYILLLVWLIQAAQRVGRVRAMQQQYQNQYWQSMQQQQQYGYGQTPYPGAYPQAGPPGPPMVQPPPPPPPPPPPYDPNGPTRP